MNRLKKAAILTRLIQGLRGKNSWCGETHVQKATFLLQEMTQVPLGFDFILYKHGPFSFDLRDELTSLRADELIALEPQAPYGPRIAVTDRCDYIQGLYPKTLSRYGKHLDFVADKIHEKGVAELECLATAFYVTALEGDKNSVEQRTEKIKELKPHLTRANALQGVKEIDRIMEEIGHYLN